MIKLWGSIPSISVCLAERAACDQVQLIFGQESAPYLMSWPKRLKSSHVLGLFWKWRFLGSLESGHWTFQCFFCLFSAFVCVRQDFLSYFQFILWFYCNISRRLLCILYSIHLCDSCACLVWGVFS